MVGMLMAASLEKAVPEALAYGGGAQAKTVQTGIAILSTAIHSKKVFEILYPSL